MVIRGLIRAKLLGLQLLTLEAQVVVNRPEGGGPVVRSVVLPARAAPAVTPRPVSRTPASGPGKKLDRAIELVGQSADALSRSRAT